MSTGLFGSLLTWMNDHTSDIYPVATCNHISRLPPEFSRAERCDGIFLLNLPGQAAPDVGERVVPLGGRPGIYRSESAGKLVRRKLTPSQN